MTRPSWGSKLLGSGLHQSLYLWCFECILLLWLLPQSKFPQDYPRFSLLSSLGSFSFLNVKNKPFNCLKLPLFGCNYTIIPLFLFQHIKKGSRERQKYCLASDSNNYNILIPSANIAQAEKECLDFKERECWEWVEGEGLPRSMSFWFCWKKKNLWNGRIWCKIFRKLLMLFFPHSHLSWAAALTWLGPGSYECVLLFWAADHRFNMYLNLFCSSISCFLTSRERATTVSSRKLF